MLLKYLGMKINIILLVLLTLSLFSFSQKAIYISPEGNDRNSGTEKSPLKSLTAALLISREKNIKTIILRGGKYYGASVNLVPADSELVIKNYTNEEPILYGGQKIAKYYIENKFICADLPGNKLDCDFRMILVNDSLRERSRLPEKGYFNHLSEWNVKGLPAVYGAWERKPTTLELSSLKYNPKDVNFWINDSTSAELTVFHQWDESYLGIRAVDTIHHILHFTYPSIEVPGAFGNKKYVVWNTMQGICHPGQWYIDKSKRKIYYWPIKGENSTNTEIVVPITGSLITFSKGTKKILIEGITIKATGNHLQNEGFSATNIDAAITGSGVSRISLKKLIIKQIGGSAIKLSGINISISESKIDAIGGGGIYYSGKNIIIRNCTIENTGLIFYGAVGIKGFGKVDSIMNCNIVNIPYSGICIGGDSCIVEKCTIKHAISIMQDGAAIYCSSQKNTMVRNNLIIGNNTLRFTMGIYFDEQSLNCIAKNNIVINSHIPVHCNLAKNILYKNNIFYDINQQSINYGNSSDIGLNHNLFIAPSVLFNGPSTSVAKIDTMTLNQKQRKYANPTGVSSFQNNLILITKVENLINQKLPLIEHDLLSGTIIKTVEKSEINDFKKLIKSPIVGKYIDILKFNLNRIQLDEILK